MNSKNFNASKNPNTPSSCRHCKTTILVSIFLGFNRNLGEKSHNQTQFTFLTEFRLVKLKNLIKIHSFSNIFWQDLQHPKILHGFVSGDELVNGFLWCLHTPNRFSDVFRKKRKYSHDVQLTYMNSKCMLKFLSQKRDYYGCNFLWRNDRNFCNFQEHENCVSE